MKLRHILLISSVQLIQTGKFWPQSSSLRSIRIGIAVHKDYRRQGYASDALQLLCEYAFDFLSLTQLYAHVATDNEVCMKLFTSCGFVQCGLLKDWLQVGGCYKDAAIFQYLNPKRH